MKRIATRAAELDVTLVSPDSPDTPDTPDTPVGSAAAAPLVVFSHGFGAPGTDLVSLAEEMVLLEPALAAATFAFPSGPIDLSPLGLWGGRAWFPIDMQALDAAQREGRIDVLAGAEPPGMAAARKKLRAALEVLMGKRPWSRVVLGGFSQGAMMALDLALRLEEAVAAVIAFSPTLVDRATWQRGAALRQGLPVFVSHGRQDPLLPFRGTGALVEMLAAAGVAVEVVPFEGGHTIPFEALQRASTVVRQALFR